MIELNQILHADCMYIMKDIPDKYFELAIVDPPYGIGEDGGKGVRVSKARPNSYLMRPKYDTDKQWDKATPDKNYFQELKRVSQNQIIFGANHFIESIPFNSSCWVVWDKQNGESDFADCELAWTSFKSAVRQFTGHKFTGLSAGKDCIHPTQKPVALYKWLLHNYAKTGDKILDTHSGSGTTAVACIDMGFQYLCIEKDKDYYDASVKRINKELIKIKMF